MRCRTTHARIFQDLFKTISNSTFSDYEQRIKIKFFVLLTKIVYYLFAESFNTYLPPKILNSFQRDQKWTGGQICAFEAFCLKKSKKNKDIFSLQFSFNFCFLSYFSVLIRPITPPRSSAPSNVIVCLKMSSVRALKRKSRRQKNQNLIIISSSWPNVTDINKSDSTLKRSKSESDLLAVALSLKKDLKHYAKSERNLQSLYSNFTTSTPHNMSQVSSPTSTIMQTSTYSVLSDPEQIKVPIVGYEVSSTSLLLNFIKLIIFRSFR